MLLDRKITPKLKAALGRYNALIYRAVAEIPLSFAETNEHLRAVPAEGGGLHWAPAKAGTAWGRMWGNAWFTGAAVLPAECDGEQVFACARTGAVESLLFVDGTARGILDSWDTGTPERPQHAVAEIARTGRKGQRVGIAIEAYAGHPCVGCMPGEPGPDAVLDETKYVRTFQKAQVLLRREDVKDFVTDLKCLLALSEVLDQNSLRFGRVMACLGDVYRLVPQIPAETAEDAWRPALARAREAMKPLLAARNGDTAPSIGIIGHSHMDTAWLWTIDETIRKCARTYATALSMIDQYPEYVFLQSAPSHAEFMRVHYPEIFARVRQAVKAGRWEPNGGMWVEPDCNITSGESMIRQFLHGQAFTKKWYGFRSDCYWQPDVFGYSAALPQIMRGCGISYFLTTKMAWNDTNRFPYDTFRWQGLDGSEVIAHFNASHCWPDPKTLTEIWNGVAHKDVQDRRFCSYGFGDGGGGPQEEMIEVARRVADLEGCPRAAHTTVSSFMQGLDKDLRPGLPAWSGELYLELHRGTLTSIGGIKRGNRKAELALRDAEWAASLASLSGGAYPAARLEALWKTLLINQFHDILPGSSITEVNVRAVKELGECRAGAEEVTRESITGMGRKDAGRVTLCNSLGWERTGEMTLAGLPDGLAPEGAGITSQRYEDVEGRAMTACTGISLPSLGLTSVRLAPAADAANGAPFAIDGDDVSTPFAVARFDDRGRITSCVDRGSGRELVREGGAFNAFWVGEDVPLDWDNWDLDFDQGSKMRDAARLLSRTVVSRGPLQLRIRFAHAIGAGSTITQDVVFHSTTPRIDFETVVDWKETHTALKAGFATSLLADQARHEIQFGHLLRGTTRNLSTDTARFEVCNHKWTDVSEAGFGVSLLNDCKYGIGVLGGEMRLTLLKSGTHPDYRGDRGRHRFDYALLPHAGPWSAPGVVRPAYELNVPVTALPGCAVDAVSLLTVSTPNVVVEAVKRAEDGDGLVLRLYEAERTWTRCTVCFGVSVTSVEETNMLEEPARAAAGGTLPLADGCVELELRPFEIKTIRVR